MTLAVSIAQSGANNVTMFKPTALLVMTHKITGKKYFCKTALLKRIKNYKGSGIHWKRHLAKHGSEIDVGVYGFYVDMDRCVNAALEFSKANNIVESDEWLNHMEENGLTGWPCGELNPRFGIPHPLKGKERPEMKGRFVGPLNPRYGKPSPMRGKKNIGASIALKGRKRPEGGGKKPHAVIRIDADGTETRYDSVADAARALGINRSSVHTVCTGRNKTGAGYKWRYAND
jgi:hypothetical protein